ncbi:MAG: reactive intermediate/imine deaminase [Planctomycetes bacterium]|nr:reactive intermediate/imine deaminase [Planctomycetota bacterium]
MDAAGAPAPIGPYSQAIRVGDQLWCAGQVGLDPATGALVEGGIVAETRRAFANVDAVLAAAGASRDDVVSITVYLVDLGEFAAFNSEYAEHVASPAPARTTVQVARLPKDARVELQVVAARRRD